MIKRLLAPNIQQAKKSVLLLGPRQTGKSTLLRSLKPDLIINLANEAEFLRYSSDIDRFESVIQEAKPKVVLIDEIQRIPSLLNSVQALVDEATPKSRIKFLLSGSSARKLRRGQANLLPGRIFKYEMGGFSAAELGYKLDLPKALRFGLLPEPYLESDHETCRKLLEAYTATYLKEEIQAESLSRNIQGFARFLAVIAAHAGQILDFSKLSSKAKVSRSSCVRFVEILEDTLVAQRVEVFTEAEAADTIRHPKLYFFDPGVLNGLLLNFEPSPDRLGSLFEHLIFAQIRNSAMAHDKHVELFYFRTRSGVEVDFILKMDNKIWAIEVKAGEIATSDLTGLKAFQKYYPKTHRLMAIGSKEKRRSKDGILIGNWQDLLGELGL